MIVLATAKGYFQPPTLPRAGRGALQMRPPAGTTEASEATVSFTVDKVVKGEWTGPNLFSLGGTLVEEAKELPAEEGLPRRHARGNACIASTYVSGGQYLFLFKRTEEGMTAEWAPLSPANERVRGENDPWLAWVRERASAAPRVESH